MKTWFFLTIALFLISPRVSADEKINQWIKNNQRAPVQDLTPDNKLANPVQQPTPVKKSATPAKYPPPNLAEIKSLKPGTYFNVQWLEKLKNTKSPFQAVWGTYLLTAGVGDMDNGQRVIQVLSDHEGVGTLFFGGEPPSEEEEDLSPIGTVKVMTPTEFQYTDHIGPSPSMTTFVWSEKGFNELVCSIVLAGQYQDDAGKKYWITPDCRANFAGKEGMIEPNFDYTFDHFDFFLFGKDQQPLAFEIKDNTLKLFRMERPAQEYQKENNPWLVLKKKGN